MNFSRRNNIKQNRNNHRFLIYEISFTLLSLTLSFATTECVKKTLAIPITVTDDNNTKTNKTSDNTATTAFANETNMANSNNTRIAGSPFYEAIGKVISNSSTIFPSFNQTAEIVVEKGNINGIGNITNFESWIFPSISPTNKLAFGHGIITTTDNQMISWIGYDNYSITEKNETTIFTGKIFFNNSSSTGNLASLNNTKGIYITKEYPVTNGNEQTTKMWKIR